MQRCFLPMVKGFTRHAWQGQEDKSIKLKDLS